MKNTIQIIIHTLIFGSLALTSLQDTAWAGYKPVDVSDIQGDQRKQLMEAVRGVNKMPAPAKACYVCEQLGLCFSMDGSETGLFLGGYPGTTNHDKAKFVNKTGRLSAWQDAVNSTRKQWGKSYHEAHQFKSGAVLSFFKKDVDSVVHNTAKYLLKEMPDITRYAMLASIGRMLYKADGATLPESGYNAKVRIGSGFDVNYNGNASDGYSFMDPTGKECSLQEAFAADAKKKRWRDTVRRCENLVGARDILALFPEEVKAMRKHYKQKQAQMKEQQDAIANEAIKQANAMLQTLPSDAQERLIAEAAGMFYYTGNYESSGVDWKTGTISTQGALYLGNGSKVYGPCNGGDAPVVRELLRKVPHRVILERYAEPLKKMARYMAKDRFQNMPGILRDALRCELTGKLTTADGSPAVDGETTMDLYVLGPVLTKVPIPCAKVNADKARFTTSRGITLPYSSIKSYLSQYTRSVQLAHLCALILGPEEIAKCIPQGGEEEKEELPKTPQKSAMGSATNEPASAPAEKSKTPQKTAMGITSLEDAASPKDAQYAEGVAALRRMPTALRRAWLAENMGFCYTQSDAPAYLAPHVANDSALFVDEQGKERKLSEVATDKMAPDWVAATKAALAVGHEQVATPFKEELKALAIQTATYILNAIGETPRYSWLAEMNHLIFNPNGQSAYPPDERIWSVESGFKVQSSGVSYAKNKNMFYNPQGKITQPSAGNTGESRWPMLYRCANVAGIEAINAAFKADVDAMRAAYEKSPFYKK